MYRFLQLIFALALPVIWFSSCKKEVGTTPDLLKPVPANEVVETVFPVLVPVTTKVNDAIGGFYAGLPYLYGQTTKNYPLLVFLPGGGQLGNGQIDLPLLLRDGVAELIDEKKFPASFTVNGQHFSFITLTPQFRYYPSNAEVESFIVYARKHYRIDSTRIYLSGLSMGGIITTEMGADYTAQLAAIVPISGVTEGPSLNQRAANIARGKLPVWVFHNANDPKISVNGTLDFVSKIKSYQPLIDPKLTLFNAAVHDAWTQAINPLYKENNLSMYEWMLQYSR